MLPDAHTRLVLLFGHPVSHSRSPLIHNTAFRHQGLNLCYLAAPVHPEALPAAVAGLGALGALGANVTLPHKQAVVPLMDHCTPQATALGAVNTIVVERGAGERPRYRGDNTDVAGFLAPLATRDEGLHGAEMVVFGAGGAARAVVYALLTTYAPRRLTLVARTPARAEALAHHFAAFDTQHALGIASPASARPAVRSARLLVNATPLGMAPQPNTSPWPHDADFGPHQLAYDLVYTPAETRWLCAVAARGAATLGGGPMLLHQAAAAYVQWTGKAMPLAAVRQALNAAG